ncbi:MAG: AGE family epimerase/isomerase [Candidatus Pacebacteria bacterium]|nr:AGE family epimerase/isomerase [Candidatus Paceibacterota bacterium]
MLSDHATAYAALVAEHLHFVLDRQERDDEYPYIDAKVDTVTCTEFGRPDQQGTTRGKDILFGWVQGRAMEALAGHIRWLEKTSAVPAREAHTLVDRARTVLSELVPALRRIHRENDGRISFMMRTDGTPLYVRSDNKLTALPRIDGQANFSDLFYAKGLVAAARVLNQDDALKEGEEAFQNVVEAIRKQTFVSDLLPLNPRSTPPVRPGRQEHGPAMISLGGIALMLDGKEPGTWAAQGADVIDHILDRHVNTGQHPALQQWDFTEFVDNNGTAWEEDGHILCDPGHGLEFVGLSCKFLLETARLGIETASVNKTRKRCQAVFPRLMAQLFKTGFNPSVKGIYRSVDLKTRAPINSDMPFWNLPETIRASTFTQGLCPEAEKAPLEDIHRQCRETLFNYYLNKKCHRLPYPIRDENGKIPNRFPGFPDVDPCYHTGLTLIDVLNRST